jgi:predicted Ser/Thr protein kinase
MQVILTVTEGPHAGKVFTFEQHNTFLVGRSPEAHLSLPEDGYLSRLHFMVEVNPPLCRLIHMGRHPTQVNGQEVKVADLNSGDEIRAGQTALRFLLHTAGAAGPSTHPELPAPPPATFETRFFPGQPRTPVPDAALPPPPSGRKVEKDGRGFPVIPGFTLLQELGKGAMGVVYLACRQSDGRRLALKTIATGIPATPEASERFLREAQILQQLSHPHIVPFHEMGRQGSLLYFAMDYIAGTDAQRLLAQAGPLALGRAVRLICQLLEALAYAHARGIVHRDVKPANLMIANGEDEERCLLTDFGLARTYEASALSGLTVTGSPGGTPGFMPPEQVLDFRSAKPPADQFATAATLYRLLTARSLYEGVKKDSFALFRAILESEPVPIASRCPDLPAGLATVIHRALQRSPEQRYRDVSAFREALLPFAD